MRRCKRYPAYGAPRFTQIPDVLFDEDLRDLGLAELKVLLVIMRKTYGWHKDTDAISLSQLTELSGLDRKSVRAGVRSLEEGGYIIVERGKTPKGDAATNLYRLSVEESDALVPEVRFSKS